MGCARWWLVWPLLLLVISLDGVSIGTALADESDQADAAERIKQAQAALHKKIEELSGATNASGGDRTNPAPTVKLITATPVSTNTAPSNDLREAMRRKMREADAEERTARIRQAAAMAATNAIQITNTPLFEVKRYEVKGVPTLPTNTLSSLLSKYTGTNVPQEVLISAALDLQTEYRQQGYSGVSVAFAPKQITNGTVLLSVFEAASPQIVIGGERYIPPGPTNAPSKFPVAAYEVTGDTLLSDEILTAILGPYTGTNMGVADILKARSDLQMEYRDRGYPTVNVTIPPQQITNQTVKIRVFEGELASIVVTNNRFFSSNNVMRALPGLRPNEVLVGPVFQSELDRANANQDRQIYPQLTPGPRENTTELILDVKDRLPLHGKVEFNNQSSPGTPETRINTSAVYNNLWQMEHSVGVQYSFSPGDFKTGDWPFYDLPSVANYSAFYRLPLGNPEPIANALGTGPGNFGYDEATRKFRLPAPSNRPEMNFYASRSTIDTGLGDTLNQTVHAEGGGTLTHQIVQRDITINSAVGARLSLPMPPEGNWQSAFSFGADFKSYQLASTKTNIFIVSRPTYTDDTGEVIPGFTNIVSTPVPRPDGLTARSLDYLPLSLRYDGSLRDSSGVTSFGLGLSVNAWFSGSLTNLQQTSGSRRTSGSWVIATPSIAHDFTFHTNWTLSLHLDGQVASEPLISNEQFGAGGINSVRGYREGEVFGDDGWHASIETKTPGYVVGPLWAGQKLAVRGSLYMDYAEAYLLDPQGRNTRTPLWGVGAGAVVSLGVYWEARMLFSVPLLGAGSTHTYQPLFNFALTGQF